MRSRRTDSAAGSDAELEGTTRNCNGDKSLIARSSQHVTLVSYQGCEDSVVPGPTKRPPDGQLRAPIYASLACFCCGRFLSGSQFRISRHHLNRWPDLFIYISPWIGRDPMLAPSAQWAPCAWKLFKCLPVRSRLPAH